VGNRVRYRFSIGGGAFHASCKQGVDVDGLAGRKALKFLLTRCRKSLGHEANPSPWPSARARPSAERGGGPGTRTPKGREARELSRLLPYQLGLALHFDNGNGDTSVLSAGALVVAGRGCFGAILDRNGSSQ
jgi:hypothetical protein